MALRKAQQKLISKDQKKMLKKEKYTTKEVDLYSKLNKEKEKNEKLKLKLKNLTVQNEILDTIEKDKSKKKQEKSWHKNAFNNES